MPRCLATCEDGLKASLCGLQQHDVWTFIVALLFSCTHIVGLF